MPYTVETKIDLSVTPEVAYKKLMAFEDFSNWNPFIKKISGDPAVGNIIEAAIQLPGSASPMVFKPTVLVNDEGKEFRWKGKVGVSGIMDGEHYYIFQKTGSGTTFVHGEQFSGIFAGLFTKLYGARTKEGFESMNASFKNLCEGAS